MEELRVYLNSLPPIGQRDYAAKCKTSLSYLRKAISCNQSLGTALCVLLESESNGAVSRKGLHPDDWEKLWPELRIGNPQ
ncbi:hypothetical protein [Tatumella saanichensis]|uniref:hypothetical protein n=1 Tax=Tatumella saanichensis TaxID=480813 RepID=UPI0004A41893|nr:hypothetical protein [Tatumella saanichensis]